MTGWVCARDQQSDAFEYVHLCDNDNLPDPADVNMDQLFKVRKLVDMANETFLAKYMPARDISIDEAMCENSLQNCVGKLSATK